MDNYKSQDNNVILKEHVFNTIINTMSNNLSNNQLSMLLNTLSKTFENIKLSQDKYMLSTYVIDNESLIEGFAIVKKIAGIKMSSINAYLFTIKKFMDYCQMDLKNVDTNKIRCYLLMCEKTMSATTVDNIRRNINSFYQYLEDEDYILKNPCRKIPRIRENKKVKRFYTDMEIETMRDVCENIRELALIDLLIATGIRISEITKIKMSDINWDDKTLLIHGKGNKERIIPISVRCRKHLKDYVVSKGYITEYLFTSLKKPYGKLSKEAVGKIVKDIGNRAELPDITVHCFRRWFASDLNKKGVDPTIIQEILGHESFSTTQRNYLSKSTDKAKYIVDVFVA